MTPRETASAAYSWRERLYLKRGVIYDALYRWLLNHPSRARWIAAELFMRRLPLRRRFANAWWQLRNYGNVEAFQALYETWSRSRG